MLDQRGRSILLRRLSRLRNGQVGLPPAVYAAEHRVQFMGGWDRVQHRAEGEGVSELVRLGLLVPGCHQGRIRGCPVLVSSVGLLDEPEHAHTHALSGLTYARESPPAYVHKIYSLHFPRLLWGMGVKDSVRVRVRFRYRVKRNFAWDGVRS